MPPQSVDLRINWLRPVSARGSTPVQLLLDWFLANEDSYLQSRDQFKELRRLAKQLNASGVKCDLDDILADFQQLQELLLDEATLSQAIFKDLLPHRERLLHLVLVTKQEPDQEQEEEEEEEKKPQSDTGKVRNFSWHSPSPTRGPSAMEMLVTWLELNYGKLIRAMEKRQMYKVLEELVEQIKAAGHSGCTFSKVQSQIGHLQLNWRRRQRFSGAMLPYTDRLQKVFKGGKVPSRRHARKNAERTRAGLIQAREDGDKNLKSDRKAGLAWLAPSPTRGPCAMEIMVTWLQRNYGKLVRATEKLQGKRLLQELVGEIEAAGHSGCTTSKIRSKMYHLQAQVEHNQLTGKLSPFEARLREIFGGETAPTRRSFSSNVDSDDGNSTESETPDLVQVTEDEDNGLEKDDVHARAASSSNDDLAHSSTLGLSQAPSTGKPRIKFEPIGTRRAPIELDDEDRHQREQQPGRQRAPPSSLNEVALIASILRERHDLRERGVPQAEIDVYLPLP